ncbi:MAG: hypothetical protein EZS28_048215, partial [Streblomastix strix]
GMNQPSTWGNTQLGFSRPYNQSWTGLEQQSQEATSADVKYAKVSEAELGQQLCASVTAAAVRRKEWGKRACERGAWDRTDGTCWIWWAMRRWIWGKYWILIRKRCFRIDQSIGQMHGRQQTRTDWLWRELEQCRKMEMRMRCWIVCMDDKRNKRLQYERRSFVKCRRWRDQRRDCARGNWKQVAQNLGLLEVKQDNSQITFTDGGCNNRYIDSQQMDFAIQLNLKKAYHHLKVSEDLQRYMGFKFREIAYCYVDLPFGWKRSRLQFFRVMRSTVRSVKKKFYVRVVQQMDDLLIFSQERKQLEYDTIQIIQFMKELG